MKLSLKDWIMIIWYAIKGFFVNIKDKIFRKVYYRTEKGECILNYCNKIIEKNFELTDYDHIYAYDEYIESFRNDLQNSFNIELTFNDAVIMVKDYLMRFEPPLDD